jgi:pilus assembly protein Flp/PilA
MNKLMNLIRDEEGATAIEYGLIAALIAAGIVGATTSLGKQVVSTFTFITDEMAKATTTTSGDTPAEGS